MTMEPQATSTPPTDPKAASTRAAEIKPQPAVSSQPPQETTHHRRTGPLIGIGIILILIILGGLYAWNSYLMSVQQDVTPLPLILGDDSAGLPPTSSSDAVADIDADVKATDVDTMNSQINADFQAAQSAL